MERDIGGSAIRITGKVERNDECYRAVFAQPGAEKISWLLKIEQKPGALESGCSRVLSCSAAVRQRESRAAEAGQDSRGPRAGELMETRDVSMDEGGWLVTSGGVGGEEIVGEREGKGKGSTEDVQPVTVSNRADTGYSLRLAIAAQIPDGPQSLPRRIRISSRHLAGYNDAA
ncbi:hypothetical protein AC579_9045 [Pseudocercospora musae]|uniref:Uncharacterized protein n=1 Tax=Pseudocercospora musae TaxID=113226 RepID=A0A139ISD6_9PEZI|nr:hypothetical protein AC579_9045 [Pseudocercospora musae]